MSVDRPGHVRVAKLIRNNDFNDRKYALKENKFFVSIVFKTENRQSETKTDQEKEILRRGQFRGPFDFCLNLMKIFFG